MLILKHVLKYLINRHLAPGTINGTEWNIVHMPVFVIIWQISELKWKLIFLNKIFSLLSLSLLLRLCSCICTRSLHVICLQRFRDNNRKRQNHKTRGRNTTPLVEHRKGGTRGLINSYRGSKTISITTVNSPCPMHLFNGWPCTSYTSWLYSFRMTR